MSFIHSFIRFTYLICRSKRKSNFSKKKNEVCNENKTINRSNRSTWNLINSKNLSFFSHTFFMTFISLRNETKIKNYFSRLKKCTWIWNFYADSNFFYVQRYSWNINFEASQHYHYIHQHNHRFTLKRCQVEVVTSLTFK
jgi:hypothetical protein